MLNEEIGSKRRLIFTKEKPVLKLIEHRSWDTDCHSWIYQIDNFKYILVDYAMCPFDTGVPETMAFWCDKNGLVTNWDDWCELAVSYCEDARDGRDDCLGQLREQGIIK